MPFGDLLFVSSVVLVFCTLGAVLAWGAHQTKDLH